MDDSRIVTLDNEVNEGSALQVIMKLLYLDSLEPGKEMYLYINSPGGSILHGLAIYDTIKHIKSPVYTVCCGLAASMGAFLLSCGEKGHRAALKHSRILIHQPLIYTDGGYGQSETALRETAERLSKNRDILESIMADNIGVTVNKIHADCERDNWMSADEAKEYGLIDQVI